MGVCKRSSEDARMAGMLGRRAVGNEVKEVMGSSCNNLEAIVRTPVWGTWVAQSVKRPASARSRSRGPGVRAPHRALG